MKNLTLTQMLEEAAQKLHQKKATSFDDFKKNPKKYGLLDQQCFKKKRQKANPMPKGRPPKNYISHEKAYQNYIKKEYEKYTS
ncbi:hypothetical protein [uncultured Enterococcus sp.]|uniref:hypothetical protein n=1 Tax=uncultured Enterococcus sp. TaxID=167972 RepID=UPI002AA93DC2|nr:hypothetical protein [uncultured Enterococcus sp.]